MREFLGLTGYYRKFIRNYGKIAAPLTGAVLLQEKPVAYFSHALRGRHLLLSTYEKEMLALVMAMQKWRPYLIGRQFGVRTDHQSLKHLWNKKITTVAQQKWLYKLMGFDFVIEYNRGRDNLVADALSKQVEDEEISTLHAISQPVPQWTKAVKEGVLKNSKMQDVAQRIHDNEAVGPW
ncbi:hypothetical protein ACOSQ2_015554 [Xanthoceras sorbifolium]